MHEHKDCGHEFEYCKICDVVYCEKCGKEWTNYKITYKKPDLIWLGDGTMTVPCNHTGNVKI